MQIEIAARKEEPVPDTWGVGPDGHVSNDPKVIFKGGLLPLGGTEVAGNNCVIYLRQLAEFPDQNEHKISISEGVLQE